MRRDMEFRTEDGVILHGSHYASERSGVRPWCWRTNIHPVKEGVPRPVSRGPLEPVERWYSTIAPWAQVMASRGRNGLLKADPRLQRRDHLGSAYLRSTPSATARFEVESC
jgi:hypothetical protein